MTSWWLGWRGGYGLSGPERFHEGGGFAGFETHHRDHPDGVCVRVAERQRRFFCLAGARLQNDSLSTQAGPRAYWGVGVSAGGWPAGTVFHFGSAPGEAIFSLGSFPPGSFAV